MRRIAKFDLVSIEDLAISDIERIFEYADQFSAKLERGDTVELGSGLIMATLFYEPSTRTRLSFESAMHRMGGAVISCADMQTSSAAKGESLADTVRIVSGYADLIVLRHPHDGAARVAAEYAPCPVINGGDGTREHPTQTLCDLFVLRRKKGTLKGITVAICGDLKFGRTVHSLIYALARFGANVVAVPQRGMDVPGYVLERLATERGYQFSTVSIAELKSLAGRLDALYLTPSAPHQMALFTGEVSFDKAPIGPAPASVDAFYVTRLQRERLSEDDRAAGPYIQFDARALRTSRTQGALVMHPLPRTDELAYELDVDPRAVYFEQAAAGVPVRMGLIAWMIEHAAASARTAPRNDAPLTFKPELSPRCPNANCITRHEPLYLLPRFRLARSSGHERLAVRCEFCERQLNAEFVGHARSHRYYRFDDRLYGYVRRWIEEKSLVIFETVKQAEESGYEPYKRGPQREIMNATEVAEACAHLASQMVADLGDLAGVVLAGVVSRGAVLAMRLRELIGSQTGVNLPCVALDAYRGDDALLSPDGSEPPDIGGRQVVLVDDVINSGWTVERAMSILWQRGRPASVRLAVLIDRGHRSLPIRPNYVGKNIPTSQTERVMVRLAAPGARASKPADRVVIHSMVEPMGAEQSAR